MIYIGIGANLPHSVHGPPVGTCEAALRALEEKGIVIASRSRWYRSAPVPPSDQPWFVNGVAQVVTALAPARLLEVLHEVEADFGRVRGAVNAPRILDLDLLDFHGLVSEAGTTPVLPHPRLAARAFVLLPLRELAPEWRHPESGLSLDRLIEALPPDQVARPIDDPAGAA